jgi:hypothetical protein
MEQYDGSHRCKGTADKFRCAAHAWKSVEIEERFRGNCLRLLEVLWTWEENRLWEIGGMNGMYDGCEMALGAGAE